MTSVRRILITALGSLVVDTAFVSTTLANTPVSQITVSSSSLSIECVTKLAYRYKSSIELHTEQPRSIHQYIKVLILSIIGYRCLCLPGFSGVNCQDTADECSNHECANNATCQVDGLQGGYQCICPSGFQGRLCHMVEDHCMSNPCQHGACLNRAKGYRCFCQAGWTGITCSDTDCSTTSCLNGGTCTVMPNGQGLVCLCQEGKFPYIGAYKFYAFITLFTCILFFFISGFLIRIYVDALCFSFM